MFGEDLQPDSMSIGAPSASDRSTAGLRRRGDLVLRHRPRVTFRTLDGGGAQIGRALARDLDRLARRAHRFHRFAHHPLCPAYAGEVLRVGRRLRLCRGCSFVAGGAVVGLVAGSALPVSYAVALGAIVLALSSLRALPARATAAGPSTRRANKLSTRATPAALAALVIALGVGTRTLAGAGLASAMFSCVLAAVAVYRRRGPDRSACTGCPERAATTTCAGFRPIRRREAAFARVAGKWLAGSRATLAERR